MTGIKSWFNARQNDAPTSSYLPNINVTQAPIDFSSIGDWAKGQTEAIPALPMMSDIVQGPEAPASISSWFGDIGKTLKESGFLGSTDANGLRTDGWGGAAFSAAGGLMNGWLGMKQYGLFKEQLNQAKKQFDLNYEASKKTTNARLEDQQRARVASNPSAYSSVSDYMKKYGI